MDAVERNQQELFDLLPESSIDKARLMRQRRPIRWVTEKYKLHQQDQAAGLAIQQPIEVDNGEGGNHRGQAGFRDFLAEQIERTGDNNEQDQHTGALLPPDHQQSNEMVLLIGEGSVHRGQAGSRGFLAGQIKRIGNFFLDFVVPHTPAGQDEVENLRKRYKNYSEKAVNLAMTFLVYLISASSSSTGNTAFRVVAFVALVVAICTDVFSSKISPNQGHAMVYLSSSSLVLTTLFIFISFKNIYGLTVIFVPLIIGAILLEHKWATRVRQQSTDEELDNIFDSAARFLGFGSFIAVFITLIKGFKHVAGAFVGFFFFSTVLLAIYLMVLTTVRTNKALLFRATQLDTLLQILFVATVLATGILLLTSKQSS